MQNNIKRKKITICAVTVLNYDCPPNTAPMVAYLSLFFQFSDIKKTILIFKRLSPKKL